GLVHFTSTDPGATLPADTALVNGVGTFTVVFSTAGNHTVSATAVGVAGATSPTILASDVPVDTSSTSTSTTAPGGVTAPTIGGTGPTTPSSLKPPTGTSLPATGSDSATAIWLAVLAVVFGGTLLGVRRRRRTAA